MNIQKALEQYTKNSGVCLSKETENPVEYFVPYILMDIAYTEFNKVIKPLPLTRDIKRLKTRWSAENIRFFREFWRKMGEYSDDVLDLMDEFEEQFSDIILVIKCKVMDAVNGIPFEHQKVIAASSFFNLMCQEAQIIYSAKHETQTKVIAPNGVMAIKHTPVKNEYLTRAREYSRKFNEMYYAPFKAKGVCLNDSKALVTAIEAFENRLIRWIRQS